VRDRARRTRSSSGRAEPPRAGQGETFELHDLALVVERIDGQCTCSMAVGDTVYLRSGKVSLPPGKDFCLYALQSAIPLLPAKQRIGHPADWMETDTRVVCPDPACRLIMRIDRVGRRVLRHDDVSATPLRPPRLDPGAQRRRPTRRTTSGSPAARGPIRRATPIRREDSARRSPPRP